MNNQRDQISLKRTLSKWNLVNFIKPKLKKRLKLMMNNIKGMKQTKLKIKKGKCLNMQKSTILKSTL